MKTLVRKTALTSIAILFLLGGTTAAFGDSNRTLSTTMTGSVTNLGTQIYAVSGGVVVMAMIGGQPLNPGATIQYSLFATQRGLMTSGFARLSLVGTTADGLPVSVSGTFKINSNTPIATLPYGCTTDCQSELPFFLTGTSSSVQMTVEGATQAVPETLNIESPYFNPFGAPIVLASNDGAIVIAATYTQGTILWIGTQVQGTMVGTLGTTQASGSFTLTGGELENLVAGTATDMGIIKFSGMTPSSLNAHGFYKGTSTIPQNPTLAPGQANPLDCSASTNIPGTCTETGFQSTGTFRQGGMSGTYNTAWGVPALSSTTTLTATISQDGNSG